MKPSKEVMTEALAFNQGGRVAAMKYLRNRGYRFTTSWALDLCNEIDGDLRNEVSKAATRNEGDLTAIKKEIGVSTVAEAKEAVNEEGDEAAQTAMDAFELTRKLRLQTNNNNALRREIRNLTDAAITKSSVLENIKAAVDEAYLYVPPPMYPYDDPLDNQKSLTIELLFSDIQIGKLMTDYDSKVAERRLQEWLEVVMLRLAQYRNLGYHIEKIVFACLGDVIESDKKHDNSARACDIGTADQMKLAIAWLNRILITLSDEAPIDAVMITGNHDHDGHGLNMFMPGREHLSWPIYHAVRMMAEAQGLPVTFFIPEGSFHVHSIYNSTVLYEHGVGVATSGAALKKHVGNRIDQIKSFINLFRMGDKHNISRFNNDRHVVNGAFFGDSRSGEEYSGIAGYDGEPAQLMFAHVERDDDFRSTIYDSFAIQLGHIK